MRDAAAMSMIDFANGDATGLPIPAHPRALADAGPAFLTQAFRAFGSLGSDNAVAAIVAAEPCSGGSTGAKLLLTVGYQRPDPALDTKLFVKFSRDFTNPDRDGRGRWEMEAEVPFYALARGSSFPIAVPRPWFADYHGESGTGLVITECIPFGQGTIEPHRRKTLDHLTLLEPLPYYRATVAALARLCAAHKAGRLASDLDKRFPFDPANGGGADPILYSEEALRAELERCFDFAARCPQLLPEEVRTHAFQAKMIADALRIRAHEGQIRGYLTGNRDLVALCHWNAHIDNCWFERDAGGALSCGLIDWGRVGQISVGAILWGALSAAHHDIWDHHLDELLALFAREYHAHGGPLVSPEEIAFHLTLNIATMGVARVLEFPSMALRALSDCANAAGPYDPMFEPVSADSARNVLHVYTVFLKLWRRRDFGAALDRMLAGAPA